MNRLLMRRCTDLQTSEEYVWVQFAYLRNKTNGCSIPIYAHACRNKPMSQFASRMGLSLTPNASIRYIGTSESRGKTRIWLEGVSTPARLVFISDDTSPRYDSGWKTYAEHADVFDYVNNVIYSNCSIYYSSDASKIISGDKFGPAMYYLYVYMQYSDFTNYLALINKKDL